MLEPRKRVLARLIVRSQQEDVLEALVLGIFSRHLVHLVVLIGGYEQVKVAFRPAGVRCPGIGGNQEGPAIGHGTNDGIDDVGKDRADHEIDLLAFDQFARAADGNVGFLFVIDDDDLDRLAA